MPVDKKSILKKTKGTGRKNVSFAPEVKVATFSLSDDYKKGEITPEKNTKLNPESKDTRGRVGVRADVSEPVEETTPKPSLSGSISDYLFDMLKGFKDSIVTPNDAKEEGFPTPIPAAKAGAGAEKSTFEVKGAAEIKSSLEAVSPAAKAGAGAGKSTPEAKKAAEIKSSLEAAKVGVDPKDPRSWVGAGKPLGRKPMSRR